MQVRLRRVDTYLYSDGKIPLTIQTNKQTPEGKTNLFLLNNLWKMHSAHQQESVEIA